MKKLLLFILILSSYFCDGQNYQCLQSGVKHYFTNGNGYLRGIRIDSVKTGGDTTFYYPFHTPRGGWESDLGGIITHFDSTGGSWLGKKVAQLSDGTFLFDNLWGDTVIINVLAAQGDSWLFYRDTSGLYYKATVTSVDTMTFLGILDSVKTITINSYYDSALNTGDSLNGFQIILSKNNGFVQVFDLYTFPYHKADSVYNPGVDYYLALSLSTPYFYTPYPPGASNSIYKLVNFTDPNDNQLYASNVGDIYERGIYYLPDGASVEGYQLDTITSKTVLVNGTTYSYSGLEDYLSPFSDSYYGGTNTYYDSDSPFDETEMPEEVNVSTISCNYFMPYDSSFCTVSALYTIGLVMGEDGVVYAYKIGFGQIDFIYETDDPSYLENKLIYSNKSNNPCGSYYPLPPLNTPSLNTVNTISVFPNPATTTLTIQSTNEPIAQITITNIIGQVVYSGQFAVGSEQVVDVSGLAGGVYFVRVNGSMVRKFVKE